MRRMKLRGSAVLVSIALAGGLVSTARADDKADIAAQYTKLEQAFKSKNIDGVIGLATPDFSETEKDGSKHDVKQATAELKQMMAMMTSMDVVHMKPQKVAI